MKPTAIDLFSGCGGLTLGLRQAGFQVLAGVEISELAATTFRKNHRRVRLWNEDICEVKIAAIKRELALEAGELDLLAGCPPCQGFSAMRTLNGGKSVLDDRNDLVFQVLRFARGLRPKFIMLENVPGLAKDWRLKRCSQELRELGYADQAWQVWNAKNFGVPQRRKRLLFVASRVGIFEPPTPCRKIVTVRETIEGLAKAGQSGDEVHDLPEKRTDKVMAFIKRVPKDGGSRNDLPKEDQLNCHKRFRGFNDVYGRMAWDSISPTITGGCFNPSKGRFLHPEENRCITIREAAMLQSFPSTYKFPVTSCKESLALMIGNALPPEMIRRFALAIKRVITSHKQQCIMRDLIRKL